jgi:hypothetical protein
LFSLFVFFTFICAENAQVPVNSTDAFKNTYLVNGTTNVYLTGNITFNNNPLGQSASWLNMTVNSGVYALSFLNNNGDYGGAINNYGEINFSNGSVNFTGNSGGENKLYRIRFKNADRNK